jgi:hypothetical protein
MTPAMLSALDAAALANAEGFGVEPFAECWTAAAGAIFADATSPYYQDPRMARFGKGNAKARLAAWRSGGKRPGGSPPKERTRAETGIYRLATFRKDGTVTITWQAGACGLVANLPSVHLARGWRILATAAVAKGLTPRHVRRDPGNYAALLAAAPDAPEPILPEPVRPRVD